MCSSASWNTKKQWSPPPPGVLFIRQQGKKKPHVSMTLRRKRLRLIKKRGELRRAAGGAEMAMLNLRLHLENRRILLENERLRERADALRRENLVLHANLCKVAPPLAEASPGC